MPPKQEEQQIIKDVSVEQAGTPTDIELALDAQKALSRIEAVANVIKGCQKVSIQMTNVRDWVRMAKWDKASGKSIESFYLQDSGAQKIRPVWGIYFRNRQVTKEINPDGTYSYIVTGQVGSKVLDQLYGEVAIDIDGGRNSADAFFRGRDGTIEPDPMDVRKAALANWEARAVTALLGLKNFLPEDLVRNGIDPGKVTGVEYKEGATGGGQQQLISDAQRKRLFAIMKQAGVTEISLKDYLKNTHKIDSTSKITRDSYEKICADVEAGLKKEEERFEQG